MRKIFEFNVVSLLSAIWLVAAMLLQYPELKLADEIEKEFGPLNRAPMVSVSEEDAARFKSLKILAMKAQAKRDAADREVLNEKYIASLRVACAESN